MLFAKRHRDHKIEAELEAELAEDDKKRLLKIAANRQQKSWNCVNILYHAYLIYFYFSCKFDLFEACNKTQSDPVLQNYMNSKRLFYFGLATHSITLLFRLISEVVLWMIDPLDLDD